MYVHVTGMRAQESHHTHIFDAFLYVLGTHRQDLSEVLHGSRLFLPQVGYGATGASQGVSTPAISIQLQLISLSLSLCVS